MLDELIVFPVKVETRREYSDSEYIYLFNLLSPKERDCHAVRLACILHMIIFQANILHMIGRKTKC